MDFHRVYSEGDGFRMGRVAGGPDERGAGDPTFECRVLQWTSEDGEEGTA
jgi:hypothetical protein